MRTCLLTLFFFFILASYTNAQTKAITQYGETVTLYDNGTWEYVKSDEEESPTNPTRVQEEKNTTLPKAPNALPAVEITALKDYKSEIATLLNGSSEKLMKYFSKKNIVNCKAQLISNSEQAYLLTTWKIMNGEASRYFGSIVPEKPLTLKLINGQTIELYFRERSFSNENEKYGLSAYEAQIPLSPSQLEALASSPIEKATMSWSKRTENYDVSDAFFFIKEIPQMLKK